jgi:hypothetical protein
MTEQVQRDPVETAEAYLLAVRRGEDPAPHERALAALEPDRLAAALDRPGAWRAFWLNVYNAIVQRVLAEDPSRYEGRRQFFTTPWLTVAGRKLSLDDVEHDLLRAGQWKYGLGYVPNPLTGRFAGRVGTDAVDPRIHFALNCGAAACPPIAVYTPGAVDDQLDRATGTYLESVVEHDPDRGVVAVPRQCLWFRGDFRGKRGVLAMLRRHGLLPTGARPRLTHADYDWTLDPGNYRE